MLKQKCPDIRFKGFSNYWIKSRLGDMTNCFSGGTPAVGIKQFYGGSIPFIRSGEISTDKTELFLTQEGLENSSAKLVNKGDILYALYGATSGEVSRSQINGAINQAILAIVPTKLMQPKFLTYWLRKSKLEILNIYLQGGQGNLSAEIVKNLLVNMPSFTEENEQILIGDFFQQIDQFIALYEKKHIQTLNFKKAMLEKMFPKAESKQPEIRLKGFSGNWTEYQLEQLGTFKNGMNMDKSSMGFGNPFVNLQNIFDFTEIDETQLELVNASKKQRQDYNLLQGDVLFVRSSVKLEGVGDTAVVTKEIENTTYSGFIIRFRSLVDIDIDYKKVMFSTSPFRKQVLTNATSSANTNINQESLKNFWVLLPEVDEQKKIGGFFKQLEDILKLQEQQLEKLKNLKHAFLEKMFV